MADEQKALSDVAKHAEEGRELVCELQREMDAHYVVIREYLGAERGPGFAHRINSKLLRLSGHFFQIGQRVEELTK